MSKSTYYSYDEWKKFYLKKKEKNKYSLLDFNNKPFEPFHIFSVDNNKANINCVTDEMIKLLFPKPECYTCTGNIDPRPMDCYKKKGCMWFIHYRYDKETKDRSPIMELSQKNSKLGGFYTSRPTMA